MRLIGLISLMGLMGACSSGEEPVPTEQVTITFSGSEGAESAVTRAATPLSEKARTFHVWGYKNMSYENNAYGDTKQVFPGYVVNWTENSAATTTTNSNGWEYVNQQATGQNNQTVKYWDWSAKAYRFFAVTGYEADGADEANKAYGANEAYGAYAISMLVSTEAVDDAPYFSRLWFSTGNAAAYPDKQFGRPVTLEFLKPFSRVRFIYNYVYPREGITLTGQSFKPTDTTKSIARKGTVTVHYPTEGSEIKEWYTMTPDADGTEALTDFTEDYDPEDDTKIYTTCDDGWYTVLPNNAQGSYTLTVSVNGESKTAVVPAEFMQWLPGYSYTYVFKITDEGGVEIGWVDYAVTTWKNLETERTVYNW